MHPENKMPYPINSNYTAIHTPKVQLIKGLIRCTVLSDVSCLILMQLLVDKSTLGPPLIHRIG
jgi:hypothetical protein